MSSNFGLYSRLCGCYFVETLDLILFLLRVLVLVCLFFGLFYKAVNLARLKLQTLPLGQQFKSHFSSLSLGGALGRLPHTCMVEGSARDLDRVNI